MRFQSLALAFALSSAILAHPDRDDRDDRDGDRDDNRDGDRNNNGVPDVGDVDFDDLPVACRDTCNPVVLLTKNCDNNIRGDDAAELRCICSDQNAPTAVPACAACINQNGGYRGKNDDVNEIMRACNFAMPSGPTPTGPRGNGAPTPTPGGGQGGQGGQGQGGQGGQGQDGGQGGQNGQGGNGQGGQGGGQGGGQNGNGQNGNGGQNFGAGAVQNTGRPNAASGNKIAGSMLVGVVGIAGLAFFL